MNLVKWGLNCKKIGGRGDNMELWVNVFDPSYMRRGIGSDLKSAAVALTVF